ncbi:MAG TPA: M48 family metallopeptidase [Phycisphaerales bacterium]|nr:M48 family metallopeptidase [Phycisphaerales bacterium]
MSIFPILLIVIVIAADGGLRLAQLDLPASTSAWMAVVPIASIFAMLWIGTAWCGKKLDRGGGPGWIILGERLAHHARWLILINHAFAVLLFGWLDAVRSVIGNVILLDELITILPPVLGVIATWWAYFPIERRLREALTIRRLDLGQPLHPLPSRGMYVFMQARIGLLMLLVPILLIVALSEAIRTAAAAWLPANYGAPLAEGASVIAAAGVFLFAPLMARLLLGVKSMPPGPVRDDLLGICGTHRVKVRDLLLWNTGGSMINAAVMGLIGRLRYVLITDALLESMTERQVKAVMAHEVAHVRKHHLPWMIVVMIALITSTAMLMEAPFMLLHAWNVRFPAGFLQWLGVPMTIAQVAVALAAFGWVSRRFERQADTFAAQHLSVHPPMDDTNETEPHDGSHIREEAVRAMQGALETIAVMNAVDPRRSSWRHGSIVWRQAYLQSIVGQPTDSLPIDRTVKRLKRATAIVLVAVAIAWIWLEYGFWVS